MSETGGVALYYVEDFAIEERPKMARSCEAKCCSYSCAGPKELEAGLGVELPDAYNDLVDTGGFGEVCDRLEVYESPREVYYSTMRWREKGLIDQQRVIIGRDSEAGETYVLRCSRGTARPAVVSSCFYGEAATPERLVEFQVEPLEEWIAKRRRWVETYSGKCMQRHRDVFNELRRRYGNLVRISESVGYQQVRAARRASSPGTLLLAEPDDSALIVSGLGFTFRMPNWNATVELVCDWLPVSRSGIGPIDEDLRRKWNVVRITHKEYYHGVHAVKQRELESIL